MAAVCAPWLVGQCSHLTDVRARPLCPHSTETAQLKASADERQRTIEAQALVITAQAEVIAATKYVVLANGPTCSHVAHPSIALTYRRPTIVYMYVYPSHRAQAATAHTLAVALAQVTATMAL
jgi:hypothetical protein